MKSTSIPTPEPTEAKVDAAPPSYSFDGDRVARSIVVGGVEKTQAIPRGDEDDDPARAWHIARLQGARWNPERPSRGAMRIIDLFSGAGGLGYGVSEAVACAGWRARNVLAMDLDEHASGVHYFNAHPALSLQGSVRDVLNIQPMLDATSIVDLDVDALRMPEWPEGVTQADIVMGGPPCQGHSNFNNVTRRTDPRNSLYLWMPAAALATHAKILIVENVVSVKADAGGAVELTLETLDRLGYVVAFDGILSADRFGVAQTRRRHFLVAIRRDVVDERTMADAVAWLETHDTYRMTVMDAIGDLEDPTMASEYDTPSTLSEENQRRIDWLFDNDASDLVDRERPASHRDGHTYPSVYGRIDGSQPSQTITTGFLSPGRGRYVHPTRRRTMTPHEGARIQGFPDTFRFRLESGAEPGRTHMATMIGDAVPPPLAFHVGLAALQMVRW